MLSSKKTTCKGKNLRQIFIRVDRLELESAMLVFSTQLCELVNSWQINAKHTFKQADT